MNAGLERRREIVRRRRTLCGGDRPKLSDTEFHDISVMPRSCYELWGLNRKPLSESRVSKNLHKRGAGGLHRTPYHRPFPDVLKSETAPAREVQIAPVSLAQVGAILTTTRVGGHTFRLRHDLGPVYGKWLHTCHC
jgi:hypothetical protein